MHSYCTSVFDCFFPSADQFSSSESRLYPQRFIDYKQRVFYSCIFADMARLITFATQAESYADHEDGDLMHPATNTLAMHQVVVKIAFACDLVAG